MKYLLNVPQLVDYLAKLILIYSVLCEQSWWTITFKFCLVGIATAEASILFGVKTDLTARFKEECPWLLANHCTARRLQLSAEKAANAGP